MDRPEVSRRLKAARWLAGGLDEKGRPAPLSPEALAQREQLQRNGITANAITEIERMVKDARPMELREIRDALGLPVDWFDASTLLGAPHHGARGLSDEEISRAAELLGPQLLAAARAIRQEQEQERRDTDAQGR